MARLPSTLSRSLASRREGLSGEARLTRSAGRDCADTSEQPRQEPLLALHRLRRELLHSLLIPRLLRLGLLGPLEALEGLHRLPPGAVHLALEIRELGVPRL